jgi:hypothetical protein
LRSKSKPIACLLLLLTFWSAIAAVVHQHASAEESIRCTVCVAAHSAAPRAQSSLTLTSFLVVSTVRTQAVSAKQRLIAFALSVRPPPAV